MAAKHQYTFSTVQVEALIKALEHSGVNSGSWTLLLETYRDPQLAKAAESIRRALLGKVGRAQLAAAEGGSELLRETHDQNAIEEQHQRIRDHSNEIKTLKGDIRTLIGALESSAAALDLEHYELAKRKLADALEQFRFESDF